MFSGEMELGFYIAGFLWGFVLQFIQFTTRIFLDILQWLLVTVLVGFVFQSLYAVLKRKRFYNPVTNKELIDLFAQVTSELGKGQGIELWLRDIDRDVFLATSNPFYKAILFSKSAISDILEKEKKGKVLLAREVLKIEDLHPLGRTAMGLLGFTFFSFLEFQSTPGPLQFVMFSMGLVIPAIMIITIVLIFTIIPFTSSRSGKKIDQALEELYGITPEAAMIDVLTGIEFTDELIEETKRKSETELTLRKRESLKNGAIAAMIAVLFSFVIMYSFHPDSPIWVFFLVVMPLIIGVVAFAVVYITGLMWDFIKPGGERMTEWDVQVPFAADVQDFLHKFFSPNEVVVRAVKPPMHEKYGLVISKLNANYQEKPVCSILPHTLEDIHDVELVGSLILSEIKRNDIEKRYNRFNSVFVGGGIIFLAGSMLYSFTLGFERLFGLFVPIFLIYFVMAFVPIIVLSLWKRNAEIKSDIRVANECPKFIEVLQILIDRHHTLPYGVTSYRSRLERVEKKIRLVPSRNENT